MDFVSTVESFANLMLNFNSTIDKIQSDLSAADCEIQDLLHEIELSPLSAVERTQVFIKLKEALVKRRKIKDYLDILKSFRDTFYKQNSKLPLDKTLENIKNIQEKQKNRTYAPRVRTDLKIGRSVANG